MSTYTIDNYPNEIHFLNDGCIESCLTSRSNDRVNPIPSYDAVSAAYEELSSLSVDYGKQMDKLASFKSETNAKIDYLSNEISTTVSNDITSLRDDMSIQQTSSVWLSGRYEEQLHQLNSFKSETNVKIDYLSNEISTTVSNDITSLRDDMSIQQTSSVWLSGKYEEQKDKLTSFKSETDVKIDYLSNEISTTVSNDITSLRDDMSIQQMSAVWLSGLINALSAYDSTLSTTLNTGYAKYDTLSVACGSNRLLSVIVENGDGDVHVTTLNTDQFLLHRIFNNIRVNGTKLEFGWTSDDQQTTYIPVDLSAFTQIYNGKDGISVIQCNDPYAPHAFDIVPDYNKVASTGSVNELSDTVKDLSGIVIAIDRANPKLIKFAAEISYRNDATYLSDYVVNIENVETKIPAGSLVYVKTDISTADPLELEAGDYLLFHTHDGQPYVDLADPITVGQNLFIIRSNATTKAINSNFVWLSGNNTAEHNHMISGMNEISALSVGTMSAYAAEFESLTANSISVDFSKLTNGTSSVVDISNQITSDARSVYNDLSDAISSKIWFKSYKVNELSGVNGDLSVIKMTGTDYDEILSDPELSSTISESAVYIIDRDYIEGYGRQLCNIVMDPNGGESLSTPDIAVTKIYADAISSYAKEISSSISSWHDTGHIAIGQRSFVNDGKTSLIAIGQYTSAYNDYSIAIGGRIYNKGSSPTTLAGADHSIAIGPAATTKSKANSSIALGREASVEVNAANSIAIGAYAIVSSNISGTVQIYKNDGVQQSDSLYFKNTQIVNSTGEIPLSSIETGFAKSDDLTSYLPISQISTYQTQVIDYSHPELSNECHPTALSVIKVPVDVYADLLAGECADTKYGIGDPNHVSAIPSALYVVDNPEYHDAFGQEIKNVGYPNGLSSAATRKYVDDAIVKLSTELFGEDGIITQIQQKLNQLLA